MTSTPQPAAARDDRFTAHYRSVAPALRAWAGLHVPAALRHRLDPDDLVQEVCYRALCAIDGFDEERGPFRAWLFGIANNVLREAGRAVLHAPVLAGSTAWRRIPARSTAITTRIARDDAFRRLLERLRALGDEERRLLIYRGLEGLPLEEVGALLGVSADTAGKRWQRLRARVRAQQPPFDLFGD